MPAGDFGGRPLALYRRVVHAKLHARPAQGGVANHVFLGVAVAPGDEANLLWQERQWVLAGRIEEPLCRQLLAKLLEPLQQLTEADVREVKDLHRERSALHPEIRFHERDDAVALREV